MVRRSKDDDPLCCCEFVNQSGERRHILQCCCDCEAVDSACDRLLKCEKLPIHAIDSVLDTMFDRCRLPWIGGAIQVNLDVFLPVAVVPFSLIIACIHAYVAVLVLTLMPLSMYLFYRTWQKRTNRKRTQFFFSWAVTSMVFSFHVFEIMALGLRKILLWENLLVVTLTAALAYMVYLTKQNPGFLAIVPHPKHAQLNGQAGPTRTVTQEHKHKHKHSDLGDYESSTKSEQQTQQNQSYSPSNTQGEIPHQRNKDHKVNIASDITQHPVGDMLMNNFGFHEEELREKQLEMKGEIIYQEKCTWVDARPFRDGKLVTFCNTCNVKKTPRSGHCTVCNVCVQGRDHHCVWIDTCIGVNNHRAFLLAMFLFIITGIYGAHLSLTSVCTPEMYLDWFLWPNDCRFVYSDNINAIVFVTAMYSIIACSIMCFSLFHQFILISQNLTGQEQHMAAYRGLTTCGLFASNNVNNHSFYRNWRDFLQNRRNQAYGPGVL
ncbi:unnamed protein product [Owenia fusiformis]|uniref:Palmitoyltransferase n=1 Tax=Owenia fusiformis TaxID=6347 RepID=A0A8J1XUN9_OWEFU|nr:unnamed protein product [Owenia fusiformis]